MTKSPGHFVRGKETADALSPDAYAALSKRYYGGFPVHSAYEILRPRGASERLNSMLKVWDDRSSWQNVTFVLGFSGDPRAVEWLIGFLSQDGAPPIVDAAAGVSPSQFDPDVYDAKTSVPYSLGLLINKFDFGLKKLKNPEDKPRIEEIVRARTRAFTFLVSHAPPAQQPWAKLVWPVRLATQDDVSMFYQDLSLRCIEGMGVSGDPKALKHLNMLKREHLSNAMANAVSDAIDTSLKVQSTTLKQYLLGLGRPASPALSFVK